MRDVKTCLFTTESYRPHKRVTAKSSLEWSCGGKTLEGDHILVYEKGNGIIYEWIAVNGSISS
jgi:hypothetical protein